MLPELDMPPGIDGIKLLRAISIEETSGGANNCPRFEAAFMPSGSAFTIQGRLVRGTGTAFTPVAKARWDKWGLSSAASYSRWQILYHAAADLGYDSAPWLLWDDKVAMGWCITKLNKIAKLGATSVEQFADAWNSGSFRDRIIPHEYIADILAHYNSIKGE
jgi:hypothetical protein